MMPHNSPPAAAPPAPRLGARRARTAATIAADRARELAHDPHARWLHDPVAASRRTALAHPPAVVVFPPPPPNPSTAVGLTLPATVMPLSMPPTAVAAVAVAAAVHNVAPDATAVGPLPAEWHAVQALGPVPVPGTVAVGALGAAANALLPPPLETASPRAERPPPLLPPSPAASPSMA